MDELTKYFLMIGDGKNDHYFEFNPGTTICKPVEKTEFVNVFSPEKDRLTVIPRIIKTDHCPGCSKSFEEKSKDAGIPEAWESEAQYLNYIYSESDAKLRIKAKELFDRQYR